MLVDRRMAKSPRMRWSRRDGYVLLQARSAAYDGTFGFGHGQLLEPMSRSHPTLAKAA
jgi:hypothetical protein